MERIQTKCMIWGKIFLGRESSSCKRPVFKGGLRIYEKWKVLRTISEKDWEEVGKIGSRETGSCSNRPDKWARTLMGGRFCRGGQGPVIPCEWNEKPQSFEQRISLTCFKQFPLAVVRNEDVRGKNGSKECIWEVVAMTQRWWWLGLVFIVVRGEKWLDSGYILKMRPSRFVEGLDLRCTRKSEVKDHLKTLVWVTGKVVIELPFAEINKTEEDEGFTLLWGGVEKSNGWLSTF